MELLRIALIGVIETTGGKVRVHVATDDTLRQWVLLGVDGQPPALLDGKSAWRVAALLARAGTQAGFKPDLEPALTDAEFAELIRSVAPTIEG